MRPVIPRRHRILHLFVFSRLLELYNVAISALGGTALVVLTRGGLLRAPEVPAEVARGTDAGSLSEAVAWADAVEPGLVVMGLLMATAGHWLAVLVVSLAHRNEYALHRAGGWARRGLWVASWLVSGVVGTGLVLAGAL